MDCTRQCAAVFPCHDEAASIGEVVAGVRQHLPTVIVVDDGSEDGTANAASQAGAEIIRLPRNTGKGAALQAGWQRAHTRGFTWALNLDGDGQHRPEDIRTFLRCADETGALMIVGNRMHRSQAIPWLRRTVNRWMSRQLSARAGQPLPDSQCGFRLLNLPAWAALRLETDHFEIESEILLAFVHAGYRVEFVPIQVIGEGPHSHIHPLKDTWRWLQWWQRDNRG